MDWLATYYTNEDLISTAAELVAVAATGHGVGSGLNHQHKIRFSTYHSGCTGCYRSLRVRRILSVIGEKISLVLVAFGVIGAIGALMFGVILWSTPTERDKVYGMVALATAVVGLGLGLWLPKVLRQWRTPKTLRHIGVWPYFLEDFSRSVLAGKGLLH